ncbi:MAG: hypothetical protein LC687_08030, partial [Actinobacteria bacterium]|nr:hypothetical protein [Actinomycetota bacterium]
MKYRMIKLVLVLLAVLVAASCDVNQPHEEIEQEPEPPEMVSILIQASEVVDGDSVRVRNASIEFNGNGYNNKVVATNGIFDEMLEAQDVNIDVYAYAEGFKTADTLTINLSNDVNEVIILEREDEEPDPEGPGKLEFTAQSCADDGSVDNGTLTVKAENGFIGVKLIDVESNEVVKDITGLSPEENQEYTFSGVPNGEYKATATLNERESTTEETAVINCEAPEGPGKVKVTSTTCADPDTNNGSLTVTVENGAESLLLKHGSSGVDSKESVKAGEEITFADLPVGSYEVVAKKDNISASAFATITQCDQPEPPTARFSVETDGLTAYYDGSESTTPNEKIVEWAWDFDNNDDFDEMSDEPTIEHKFDSEGSKT